MRNLHETLLNRISSVDINQNKTDVRVAVVSEPSASDRPVSPRLVLVAVLCLVGAGVGGIAVVYVNKRGMGDSTVNWINNTIEGRSSDIQAVADLVRTMPQIDVDRVGYAGHSQGG